MKLFHFYRIHDHSGVSGTGAVVEGVQFTNGWCALRWITAKSSICFYQSIEDVKNIHGHGGNTEIVIHDLEPLARISAYRPDEKRFDILMEIIEEAARITGFEKDPTVPLANYKQSVGKLRALSDALERSLGLPEEDSAASA
jgi:hypothetical protein